MLLVISENDNIEKKDLDYEEILNSIVSTIKSSDIEIYEDSISNSDNIIELEANIRQVSCNWIYKLNAFYNIKNDYVTYDLSLQLLESGEELRVSDISELANLMKSIEEIMNV